MTSHPLDALPTDTQVSIRRLQLDLCILEKEKYRGYIPPLTRARLQRLADPLAPGPEITQQARALLEIAARQTF